MLLRHGTQYCFDSPKEAFRDIDNLACRVFANSLQKMIPNSLGLSFRNSTRSCMSVGCSFSLLILTRFAFAISKLGDLSSASLIFSALMTCCNQMLRIFLLGLLLLSCTLVVSIMSLKPCSFLIASVGSQSVPFPVVFVFISNMWT